VSQQGLGTNNVSKNLDSIDTDNINLNNYSLNVVNINSTVLPKKKTKNPMNINKILALSKWDKFCSMKFS
jgi:hypothetical protein